MGSDLYLNPPPPPPVWEQVKALQERYAEMSDALKELRTENDQLHRQHELDTQLIAQAARDMGRHE